MKRSASSNESPPERPTLFIDRNAWSNALHEALAAASIPHQAHRWLFSKHDRLAEVSDATWLSAVANRGWAVVTRDKSIRYRINELAAMRAANLHVFVITHGALTAADTSRLLVAAYPMIVKAIRSTVPPAFFSITRNGQVNRLKV